MFALSKTRHFSGAKAAALAMLISALVLPAGAAEIVFDTDPFAGNTALTTPGRQIVANELFVPSFDFNNDRFVLDGNIFGITGLQFFNGLVSGLPASGINVVILQTTDNDANPATPFAAGTAANLIAAQITADGPGFFIYHNQGLGMNRLVFSTNLNDPTADLKILARVLAPTGVDAIAALGSFQANDFTAVPEPATVSLLASAGALAFALSRRIRRQA
jgi:PEP-CTERM motif